MILFDDFMIPSGPSANVYKTSTGYTLELEVPGVSKEQVNVSTQGSDCLLIKIKSQKECEGISWIRHEFNVYHGEQKFSIPTDVDLSGITATVKDGILKVELPKKLQDSALEIEVK